MPSIGSAKLDKIITFCSIFLGIPLAILYVVAMIIFPFLEGDWLHIQSVWDRWQSLNVGILAFASSVIAFNISIFNSRRQKEKEFIAARAFLPDALSSLCRYLESCAILLKEAYNLNIDNDLYARLPPSNLNNNVPDIPPDYKEIFSRCISLAEPELGNHLAKILTKLQIQRARIIDLPHEISETSNTIISKSSIISHLIDAGELYALINMSFGASRGEEKFITEEIAISDYTTAYFNLKISSIPSLNEHTKSVLNNKN